MNINDKKMAVLLVAIDAYDQSVALHKKLIINKTPINCKWASRTFVIANKPIISATRLPINPTT